MALKIISINLQSFYEQFSTKDLHLQTAHYSTEETNHAKILDNIDRLHCQFLYHRCYGKQYHASEAQHITDKMILSFARKIEINK